VERARRNLRNRTGSNGVWVPRRCTVNSGRTSGRFDTDPTAMTLKGTFRSSLPHLTYYCMGRGKQPYQHYLLRRIVSYYISNVVYLALSSYLISLLCALYSIFVYCPLTYRRCFDVLGFDRYMEEQCRRPADFAFNLTRTHRAFRLD
jgi:hypothetical protein